MAVAIAATDLWANRRRRVAELRARHGFARQVLDFYAALLAVQEGAYRRAQADAPPPESVVPYVVETVMPRILDVTVAAGPDRLRAELMSRYGSQDSHVILRRWLAGEAQAAAETYLARASAGPVVEALDAGQRAVFAQQRDGRHCPECGGLPQVSFFAAPSEDLASGGRFLVCSRCAATWGYARMTCAACGEDSASKLTVLSEHGTTSGERGSVVRGLPAARQAAPQTAVFPHMRIETCDSCRKYVLSVDLATEPAAEPLVDELTAIPLDLFARERGYTKIVTNLMGF
jgi:formate dehydrogenase maturation protein FdhE